jgi:hypothetical protein
VSVVAVQDHHGGSLWVKDAQGWFLLLNLAGIEWSAQFCADPAKVDQLRAMAKRCIDAFPLTLPGYEELGYHEGKEILETPITDAAGVARWTDSIFNAGVPLPADSHTGVLPKAAGFHHYPKPIVDMEFFKHDDFTLFVTDSEGQPAAVAPVAPRGSGDGRVAVLYATPGTKLHKAHAAAHTKGKALTLPTTHPLAKQAFAKQ